jgi:glycosyltransferase involved in cell wall biosynthesis
MKKKNITFSVVIPYYNSINTINRTLLSVLYQDCRDYEIIVINDFSTDIPIDIIEDYKKKFETLNINLTYIELKKNSGPSFARNYAWNLAIGNYICFLDSDDMWHPNKLSICKNYIIDLQPQLLFHDSLISRTGMLRDLLEIDYTNSVFTIRNIISINWLLKNLAVTPAIIVNKDISLRFNEEMKYSEDYDLWLRIAFKYPNVIKINGPALTFLGKPFMSGNGLSSNYFKMRIGEIKLYFNFCLNNLFYLPLFPILLTYSILKHIRLMVFKKFNKNY